MLRLVVYCLPHILYIFFSTSAMALEENFILINGLSGEKLVELGGQLDERVTPCSTFKIALSLMGFDSGILQDESSPVWEYQEGYDDFIDAWKGPQTPQSWMHLSCIWYSRLIAAQLGMENFQNYLTLLDYGNQDASGGLTSAWLVSSLKISPYEQTVFLQKMLMQQHPLSSHAVEKTKQILFQEELPNGWSLYGKTGWSGRAQKLDGINELGWFIGWIEKDNLYHPFAYNIRDLKLDLKQRIPRVKQLILENF